MPKHTRLPLLIAIAGLALAALPLTGAEPEERAGAVHGRGGAALTLVGPALVVGQAAPPSTGLRDKSLQPAAIAWNDGTVRIVTTAPSLDTPTCSKQARAFNERAAKLAGVEIIFVSRDLPFAQGRFCAAEGIAGIKVLSDYYDGSFARAWGLFIKELGLDARASVVVDGGGIVRYVQIVADLPQEPDYDAVLAAAQALKAK